MHIILFKKGDGTTSLSDSENPPVTGKIIEQIPINSEEFGIFQSFSEEQINLIGKIVHAAFEAGRSVEIRTRDQVCGVPFGGYGSF